MIATPIPPQVLERLCERLQSGWESRRDEIDMRMPQLEVAKWDFLFDPTGPPPICRTDGESDLDRWATLQVQWIDADLR